MNDSELRNKMIEWAHTYNVRSFIENDPVQFVHKFKDTRDIEVVGLLVSWISWGNRKAIISKGKELIAIMQGRPYDFLMYEEHKRFKGKQEKIYRTFSYDDFYKLCESMRLVYEGYSCIGQKMSVYKNCRYDQAIRQMLGHCYGIPSLFSTSSAKRVNMFLRWMVRKDDVDVGVWGDFLDKSKMLIPVDTHVMRMAVELGITSQKTANEKAMLEITEYFKAIFPDDPCMGDFALFGYGVNNKQKVGYDTERF